MTNEDLRTYGHHTAWLLCELVANLREASPEILVKRPPVRLEGNNLLAIGKHAAGVTRAYVLGFGCGLPANRDRSQEFTATAMEAGSIIADLDSLRDEVPAALLAIDASRLDIPFLPERSLYGTGEIREMTPRDAIVNNIRHLGIHLGEARLTRSLLES